MSPSAQSELVAAKDAAYLERNRCVALLARMAVALGCPVAVTQTRIEGWDPEWHNCVFIELPTGQVSWHFHDSEAYLFDGLPVADVAWDGHTTPRKYERVARAFPAPLPYLNQLRDQIHAQSHHWWHDAAGNRLDRNKGELLCLIHSEISEAMEGERKSLMDDHLPHRRMAEVELADALIRIMDYAGAFGYDIAGAVAEKLAYNRIREDHTHAARAQANGKKF